MKQKQLILAGAGLMVALIAVMAITRSGDAPASSDPPIAPATGELWPAAPSPWDDPQEVVALVATDDGPAMFVSPKDKVLLTPRLDDLVLKWTYNQSDAGVVFTGAGTWNDRPATARWVFADGNPQATFELVINQVAWATLAALEHGPTLKFPVGDVRHLDDRLRITPFVPDDTATRIDAWTPGWLRWEGQGRTLQISQWYADGVLLSATEGGGSALEFVLFNKEARGWQDDCEPMAALTTDVKLRFILTVGSAPMVVPGRFPQGARAMVAAVFSDPSTHTGAIKKEAAKTPQKFVARARTLAMGHSDPADPRYGNGGLASTSLGGTIVWAGADSPEITAFRQTLDGTTELASREADAKTQLSDDACEQAASLRTTGARALLAPSREHDGAFVNAITAHQTPAFGPGEPARFSPLALGGSREQLLQQALSTIYLNRLEAERGLFVFSTPLVATRNPLVGAAADALLQPERDGEWTLDPMLAKSLAGIELMAESSALGFTSLSQLVEYWDVARQSLILYDAQGDLMVYANEPLTVIVDGARDPKGESIKRAEVVNKSRQPQTWFVASQTDVAIPLGLEPEERLRAVEWSVRQ